MSPASTESDRAGSLASLALAVLGGALSVWTILDRGWVPFDEGTIAQAAERVLHGELSHRDFTDPYSGGLPYWHALAMRAFGPSLMAPRYGLFLAFLLWLPAVWWLARRAVGHRKAAVVTIVAAWWSLPVYPAAMPTWYLLFIGAWIVCALERWHATSRVRWLAAVGVLCGVAVAVKQTGLYLMAGALLGLLFIDQEDARLRRPEGAPAGRTDVVVLLLLALLGALVLKLMWGWIKSGELLHLVLPIAGLLALAALRESRLTDARARRWRGLLQAAGVVVLAAAVPLALFLLPYARSGSLGTLYADAVGGGVARISALHWSMRPATTLLLSAWPVYVVLLIEAFARGRTALRAAALILGVLLLYLSVRSGEGYRRLWFFATSVLPIATAAVVVAGHRAWRARSTIDPILLVLAGVTAFHALNQFPYAAPNYFAYVAPLAILTAAAAASHFGALARLNTAALLLAGFAAFLRLGSVHNVGFYPAWWDYAHRLAVPRGGLLVTTYDSGRYTRLLELVERHRAQGTVYAGPELPEVYFLSGTRSPGRDSYSLFARDVRDSTELPGAFDAAAANVIVIKTRPMFTVPLRDDIYRWLTIRYPQSATMDTLQVRWRER